MNVLVAVIALAAIVLLITAGVVPTLNFLLWVGIALAVIAVILFLIRFIGSSPGETEGDRSRTSR